MTHEFKTLGDNNFDAQSFYPLMQEYIEHLFKNQDKTLQPKISIYGRPLEKKEFEKQSLSSTSNSVQGGDIIITPDIHNRFEQSKLYLTLGTIFDTEDVAESFLRKYVYDKLHDYQNAHKIHSHYSCIKPNPFDNEYTPSFHISFLFRGHLREPKDIARDLETYTSRAVQYFAIIDSQEFAKKRAELKQQLEKDFIEDSIFAKYLNTN